MVDVVGGVETTGGESRELWRERGAKEDKVQNNGSKSAAGFDEEEGI